MDTGLTNTELKNITEVFAAEAKVEMVLLFGSRAKGNYSPGSDIDIAVKGEQLTYEDIIELSLNLDALELPFRTDLVHYDKVSDAGVTEHIDRVGLVLLER